MPLRLSDAASAGIEALDPSLRAVAETLGAGLTGRLAELAPSIGAAGPATLVALSLDREDEPDPLSLAACVAAHRAYVAHRQRPDAVSAGALALARLLVWAARAALIGPAPRIGWLGPPGRAPEAEPGQHRLMAECRLEQDGGTRRAQALALVSAPEG